MNAPTPIIRHPSIAAHTCSSSKSLVQSLSLIDIQQGREDHVQMFDYMVATTDMEYAFQPPLPPSVPHEGTNNTADYKITKTPRRARRHSSFESRKRLQSYNDHQTVKEYLNSPFVNAERSKFVQSLLDFNLSVNMASLRDLSTMDESPALRVSCPVLSYLNDDEEDSVDLTEYKRKVTKRSSLVRLKEEAGQRWESLDDASLNDDPATFENPREYVMEMKSLDDEKPRTKRRCPPSYKILSQKLAMESPLQVLRSLGA